MVMPRVNSALYGNKGIGIIDIKAMYGIGAVINNKAIDMVVYLEFWDNNKEYDRLGLTEEYMDILGVKLPKVVLPVRQAGTWLLLK